MTLAVGAIDGEVLDENVVGLPTRFPLEDVLAVTRLQDGPIHASALNPEECGSSMLVIGETKRIDEVCSGWNDCGKD